MSHLLVIGDIILDHYITGHSYRLSQEAPVPVVAVEEDRFVLGGAANVAANIRSLGGTATLIGVIGTDPQGDMVLKECSDAGVNSESIIRLNTRPTTEKCRVQSGHYQIVRYDRESVEVVSKDTITLIIETINNLAGLYDGVVIADYAKGLIPSNIFNNPNLFDKVPIVVDPKQKGFHRYCPPGSILKPNKIEAEAESGIAIDKPEDALIVGDFLLNKVEVSGVYITLGEFGGALVTKSERKIVPTQKVIVSDTTGAGDTVAAAFALAMASGRTLVAAAEDANLAASVAVSLSGTVAVRREQLVVRSS